MGDYHIHGEKLKLADAAHCVRKAGEVVLKKAQKLGHDVVGIDCSREVALLLRLGKDANKAGHMVLKAIRMDGATTADKDRMKRETEERRRRVETAVRLGAVVEWCTKEHMDCWRDLVIARNRLDADPSVADCFKHMLAERGIKRVGQLISLDRAAIFSSLHPHVPPSDRLAIWREVNRVRASFWGLTITTPVRSLWLLVREQFLCLEDLRLGYAILRGDVKIPAYWHTALRDGLLLLTEVHTFFFLLLESLPWL